VIGLLTVQRDAVPGKANIVGESHDESDKRRADERALAGDKALAYKEEHELEGPGGPADPPDARAAERAHSLATALQAVIGRLAPGETGRIDRVTASLAALVNDMGRSPFDDNQWRQVRDEGEQLFGHLARRELANVEDLRSILRFTAAVIKHWERISGVRVGTSSVDSLNVHRSRAMYAAAAQAPDILWKVGTTHLTDMQHLLQNGQIHPSARVRLTTKEDFDRQLIRQQRLKAGHVPRWTR